MHKSTILAVALLFVVTTGCGKDAGNRVPLRGGVTLDGEPVEKASISFVAKSGTRSPTAMGAVEGGKFSIPAHQGVEPGEFTARIRMPHSKADVPRGELRIVDDPNSIDMNAEIAKAQASAGEVAPSYDVDVKISGENSKDLKLEYVKP